MPRTAIAVRPITFAGVVVTAEVAGDVANGNVITGIDKGVVVEVTNTGGVSYTCTFETTATAGGFAIADKVETLTAAQKKRYCNFDPNLFGPDLNINVNNAAVTIAAYRNEVA